MQNDSCIAFSTGDARALLDMLGAGDHAHSGRTLRDHLLGTFELLRSWGCDRDLCIGGLLHSVYGTNAFQVACVDRAGRDRLRALIGERAERLVYLFCASERPRAFLQCMAGGALTDRFTGAEHEVSRDDLRGLFAIECANLAEQSDRSAFLDRLSTLSHDELEALAGPGAASGMRAFFTRRKESDHAH